MDENKSSLDRIKTVIKASVILLIISIIAFVIALFSSPKDKLDLDVIVYGAVMCALSLIVIVSFLIYFFSKKKNN